MNTRRITMLFWRFATAALVVLLAGTALIVHSVNFPSSLSGHAKPQHARIEPPPSFGTHPVKPEGKIAIAPSGPAKALADLPPARELRVEAERILGLFDQGRMREIYALFIDEAKAQVPESVFIEQANEVLKKIGPIKPDGWNDADVLSTILNGRSHGRKVVLWKLHPDTQQFYVGSWRFGELTESSEDVLLDVSSTPIRLAMISEYKANPPAAGVWLPRTCPHTGEDPLRHCTKPGMP